MQQLIDWYWNYGVKRGLDPNDPDRELRKISIGNWLDIIADLADKTRDIKAHSKDKATIALWGPSQTGKSTLMSRYIDGEECDGSDSALTWDQNHKTRFSPPQNGGSDIPNGTLVFNPFHFSSDASGIATRYVLKSEASGEVNPEYPVEIKLTNRAQIIQSLCLGYLNECEMADQHVDFTQEAFLEECSGDGDSKSDQISREAYFLLKDIAKVIEYMKGNRRFDNLFKKNEWTRKIRKALVSASNLVGRYENAEAFMTKIFWDSNQRLTDEYKKMTNLLSSLIDKWSGCKILASLEVAALLVDIDSYKQFVEPQDSVGEKIRYQIANMDYERVGDEIHIFIKDGGNRDIAGENFGYFQAICSELVVPLKEEALQRFNQKKDFLNLIRQCDFLDFPGVSNKNTGNNTAIENLSLVQLSNCKKTDIFTRVFKQGKTQCFVYNYVYQYGIDAFIILVRSNLFPSKSSVLNDGVKEWIRSYTPDWKPGRSTPMPVFVNMTFFSSLVNDVTMNGTGTGLAPCIERIQELNFASKESAHFYPTTYPHFPAGKILNPDKQDSTVSAFMSDKNFMDSTGMTKEALNAVYSEDGGVDYMLRNISRCIDSGRRINICRRILEECKSKVTRLVEAQLPSSKDNQIGLRKNQLHQAATHLLDMMKEAEDNGDTNVYVELANEVKSIFSASPSDFDALPNNAIKLSKKDIMNYIRGQVAKWYENKISEMTESSLWSLEEKQTILIALRDMFNGNALFNLVNNQLGQVKGFLAKQARFPFALAFNNILKTGAVELQSKSEVGDRAPEELNRLIQAAHDKASQREVSPYYHTILNPILDRLEVLANCEVPGTRPPQPGDAELKQIIDQILANDTFQI